MERFASTLKPQTILLDRYDDYIAILSIPFYFWYKDSVPANVLETAFYRSLEEFPILAGTIKTGNDSRSFVKIDKHNLNLPEYTDEFCNVDFQTLKNSNFDVSLLPVDYSSACKPPAPQGIFRGRLRLAEFHILRFKNNSGMCIFASISHAIFDGKAYYTFIRRWSDISKGIFMAQDSQHPVDSSLSTPSFQHDRSILDNLRPRDKDALDLTLCQLLTKETTIAKWFAWISPELRGRIFRYLVPPRDINRYYLHLSSSAFDYLLQSVQELVEPNVSHLSANDIITSLGTVLYAQGLHKAGRLDGETTFMTNVIVDTRLRVERLFDITYVGNASLPVTIVNELDPMLKNCNAKTIALVACSIRRAINGIDERYCIQLGHLLNKSACGHVNLTISMVNTRNAFASTNHTRFEYYQVDFGKGSPALVRPAFLLFENGFVIMRAPPDVGGYELVFIMVPKVAKGMMESEYWKNICQFI